LNIGKVLFGDGHTASQKKFPPSVGLISVRHYSRREEPCVYAWSRSAESETAGIFASNLIQPSKMQRSDPYKTGSSPKFSGGNGACYTA